MNLSNVTLASFANGLRGVMATKDLAPEATVLTIPFSSALAITPRIKCPVSIDICTPEAWEPLPPFVKMAVLLWSKSKMDPSPYLQALPTSFDTLYHWTSAERAELHYPHSTKLYQDRHRDVDAYYKSLGATNIPKKDFIWCLDCVQSRLFSGPYAGRSLASRIQLAVIVGGLALTYAILHIGPPEQALNGALAALAFNLIYDATLSKRLSWYAMCPMIDMMNHDGRVQSEVAYQYFTDQFTVSCNREFKAGDQVFISYGAKSNDQLLTYYGFVERDNAFDSYVLGAEEYIVTRQGMSDLSLERIGGSAKALERIKAEVAAWPTSLEADVDELGKKRSRLSERSLLALEFRIEKKRLLLEGMKGMSGGLGGER